MGDKLQYVDGAFARVYKQEADVVKVPHFSCLQYFRQCQTEYDVLDLLERRGYAHSPKNIEFIGNGFLKFLHMDNLVGFVEMHNMSSLWADQGTLAEAELQVKR